MFDFFGQAGIYSYNKYEYEAISAFISANDLNDITQSVVSSELLNHHSQLKAPKVL